MQIKSVTRIIDDDGHECDIGNTIIIQTNKMSHVAVATIKYIGTKCITLEFDDPLIGYEPKNIRVSDVVSCSLYK